MRIDITLSPTTRSAASARSLDREHHGVGRTLSKASAFASCPIPAYRCVIGSDVRPTLLRSGMPMPAATFKANRPFLLLIRDVSSGCLLFVGRVAYPLGS